MDEKREVKYPTESHIIKSYEYCILWMLNNNEFCTWNDLLVEPCKVKKTALANYLNQFIEQKFISKFKRAHYKITNEGRNYFSSFSVKKIKEIKEYPPNVITKSRNYRDTILWMLFNNDNCKWSDFLNEPLKINQSSLSKYINLLLHQGFIVKINKDYFITETGKNEYFSILSKYNLDKRSILDLKIAQIEKESHNIEDFYLKYGILDRKLLFNYLDLRITLNYKKISGVLKNELDFNKILFYLVLNHPDQYPKSISIKNFSQKFDIEERLLEFFVIEITKNQLFPITFYQLDIDKPHPYYFHQGEKIEQILSTVTKENIIKQIIVDKIHKDFPISSEKRRGNIIKAIINEICGTIFDSHFRYALEVFIPQYIDNLIEQIEYQPFNLKNNIKLEDLAVHQYPNEKLDLEGSNVYQATPKSKKIKKILHKANVTEDITGDLASEISKDISSYIEEYQTLDHHSIHLIGVLLIRMGKIKKGFEIIDYLLTKLPKNSYKRALELNNKIYGYLSLKKPELALKISTKLIKEFPNCYMCHDSHADVLLHLKMYEEAIMEYKIKLKSEHFINYTRYTFFKLAKAYDALYQFEDALDCLDNAYINIQIPERHSSNELVLEINKMKEEIKKKLKNQNNKTH